MIIEHLLRAFIQVVQKELILVQIGESPMMIPATPIVMTTMSISRMMSGITLHFRSISVLAKSMSMEPTSMWLWSNQGQAYFKNFRIAKGAVPLYDRMVSEGKFKTYGITFDVGKSTIRPESYGEINRIVKLMTDNPTIKFSVEGHTDNTGNTALNQTLSEQRSQAIVAKLVEMGIAQDRLTAVGKGQNNPIADNSTDEGRAKNRRVEFVVIDK